MSDRLDSIREYRKDGRRMVALVQQAEVERIMLDAIRGEAEGCGGGISGERMSEMLARHEQLMAELDEYHAGYCMRRALVWKALTMLDAGSHEILVLHYIDGMSLREIGARLGIAKSSASERLSKAEDKYRRVAKAIGF